MLFGRVCLIGLIVLLSACTSEYNLGTHRQDTLFYSTASEVSMGQSLADQVEEQLPVSANPAEIERVNKIGKKIASVCDRQDITYYFAVIDDKEKEVNAFALPGGYIYIYKELLGRIDDDELAYVIGHEIGHVVSRHSIKRLQSAIGYNALMVVTAIGTGDSQAVAGLDVVLSQIMSGYAQDDELNADEQAARYSKAAGFDPLAGIKALEKLYEENKKEIREMSYFRTHPFTAQRIRRIKEALHLPIDVNDYMN